MIKRRTLSLRTNTRAKGDSSNGKITIHLENLYSSRKLYNGTAQQVPFANIWKFSDDSQNEQKEEK